MNAGIPNNDGRWTTGVFPSQIARVTTAAIEAGWVSSRERCVVFHDLSLMASRIDVVSRSFPSQSLHAVAIKANPLVEVLRRAVQNNAGLEAASMEEVYLALAAGCAPSRIVFDSPAKTFDELAECLELGVIVNADNFSELERIAGLLPRISSSSRVGLRINPTVGAGRIGATSVADRDSKFGVNLEQAQDQVLGAFARYPWLDGIHVHVGSQGCGLELLFAAAARAQQLVCEIRARLGKTRISFVDIGGGLPVEYLDTDDAPSLVSYVEGLRREAPLLFDDNLQLVTEFGRAIQAGCGFALSRVEYVKEAAGRRLGVIHLGADFLLRPVYRPEHWAHRFCVLNPDGSPQTGKKEKWTFVGPLCFAGDVIGRDIDSPPVAPGDLVVIRDVGAYTLSMWSRHCSRSMPRVVGYERDGTRFCALRNRETPEGITRFWSVDPEARANVHAVR
jgi:diaminopimelate decarboxylase